MKTNRQKGREAEIIAAEFLLNHGYTVLAMNFTCSHGEIDIIGEQDGELVFVEVRSAKENAIQDPMLGISAQKCKNIIKSAQLYIDQLDKTFKGYRFDIIIVVRKKVPEIKLFPCAFTSDDFAILSY